MDLEEGHCNAPPGQVSPKAFPAGIESVRLAGARLAIADDGGCLTGTGTGTGTGNGGRGSSGNGAVSPSYLSRCGSHASGESF